MKATISSLHAVISNNCRISWSPPDGVTISNRNPYQAPILRTPEEVQLALDILMKAQEEMLARRAGL